MIYYRRYSSDYLVKTIAFTMEEDGAYTRLLDWCYTNERPVPLDFEETARIARATKLSEREAIKRVLAAKFVKKADGYHNDRADAEIRLAQNARDNGGKHVGKSGKMSHNRTRKITDTPTCEGTGDVTEMATETPSETPSETTTQTGQESAVSRQPSVVQPSAVSRHPSTKPPQGDTAEARASRLPLDWIPSTESVEWALQARDTWTERDVQRAAEGFRDYWAGKPGKDGTKLDWEATWRNWVRRERHAPIGKAAPLTLEERNAAAADAWDPRA